LSVLSLLTPPAELESKGFLLSVTDLRARRPDALIAFFFFAMPSIKVLGEALFLAMAVTGLCLYWRPLRPPLQPRVWYLAASLAGLVALKAISLLWAPDLMLAGRDVATHLHLLLFVPVLLVMLRSSQPWRAALTGMTAALLFCGGWAVVHAVRFEDVIQNRLEVGAQNSLVLCAIVVPYTLWLSLAWLRSRQHLMLIAVAAGWLTVAVSASRAPFLVLILLTLLTIFWYFRHAPRILLASILIFGIALPVAMNTTTGRGTGLALGIQAHRALTEIEEYYSNGVSNTSVGNRLELWAIAREAVAAAPWLGHGAGSAPMLVTQYAPDKSSRMLKHHFHNQYLQIATELGMAGLLLLLAIASSAWFAVRGASKLITESAALFLASTLLLGVTSIFLKQGLLNTMFIGSLSVLCAAALQELNANQYHKVPTT
jgi:O-antigen ligase